MMEYAALDLATKITWVKFQAAWQAPTATAVTCFILEYTWPGRWLTRRNLALLSIPPLLILILILTEDLHHLLWRGFSFGESIQPQFGPGGWIIFAYVGGVLGALNLIGFGWLFLHSPQHRWPVVVMLFGQLGGRVLYLLERVNLLHSVLPLDLLGMAFEFLMYAIALFGSHILDPIPLARQTAIEQLHAGMLVLDPQGRVVSLNPAAVCILGAPAKGCLGRPVQDLLSVPAELVENFQEGEAGQGEISLGSGPETRYYQLEASSLNDWRGLAVGRLLLLHDVTEQKQAQAQLLEQQRSLATLLERERLARELHDSLGQALAAAHLQASTGRLLLAQGETTRTDECLDQIAEMTLAAEADVREYLLGAKATITADLPFFPALRQFVRRFSQQYSLKIELSVPLQIEAQGLAPEVEVQLLRIIQEALSNVRKHARAKNAQITFKVSEMQVKIAIIDDGQGFDPVVVTARQGEGFGMQAMRERAEALGGRLEVSSAPGEGTRVVVVMPVNSERKSS